MTGINTLTSLARARSWAGVTTSNDDALIVSVIDEVGGFILRYLGRPSLFKAAYTEIHDGENQRSVMLRQWPVTALTSLTVGGSIIPSAKDGVGAGYILEKWDGFSPGYRQKLSLRGYRLSSGSGSVSICYEAGYQILNEVMTVPLLSPFIAAAAAPLGSFARDEGVTYANGTALVQVGAIPAQGQYVQNGGTYSFSAADAGASLRISYSYIPVDIEHACVALVAERYRSRSRIGEISKSLGGQETVSFSQKDMPEFIRTLLQPYRRLF